MAGRSWMLKFVKHVGDVVGHGNVDIPALVVPADGESVEECATPIFGDCVLLP